MRILVVAINYAPEPTGIGPYVTSLSRGLSEAGHQVRVITGIPHYPAWKNVSRFRGMTSVEKSDDGVLVRRVRHFIPSGGVGWARVLMETTFALGVVAAPWGRPDVVLSVSPPLIATAAVGVRSLLSTRRPAVVAWTQDLYTRGATELSVQNPVLMRTAEFLEGEALRRADAVIAIDAGFREFLIGSLRLPSEQVSVHPNWVHVTPQVTRPREESRRRLGWGTAPIALHAGSMGEKQGLEHVIEAARLAQGRGSAMTFVLMGQGSRRRALEAEASGLANVAIIDPVDEALFSDALAAADVLLLCERLGVREMALPSKLTSYFTAGRPVVASVHPGGAAARLLADAGAGILVPPADPSSLLQAIEGLLEDPDRASTLGEAGRRYAQAFMSESAAVTRLATELTAVATRRSRPRGWRRTDTREAQCPLDRPRSTDASIS